MYIQGDREFVLPIIMWQLQENGDVWISLITGFVLCLIDACQLIIGVLFL